MSGKPLTAHDKYSFDVPDIKNSEDWDRLKTRIYAEAKELAELINSMPDEKLEKPFVKKEYGTYYRCLQGTIEHCYYHLGQIAIIRQIIDQDSSDY